MVDIQYEEEKNTNEYDDVKDFYLERLSKTDPDVANILSHQINMAKHIMQPQASGQNPCQHAGRPVHDIEDSDVMCGHCWGLVTMADAYVCAGQVLGCDVAVKLGAKHGQPLTRTQQLDQRLRKLKAALDIRLNKVQPGCGVFRHLNQLRYHIEAVELWTSRGACDLSTVCENTVTQVKALASASLRISAGVYMFSKRIESVVIQKEEELRRLAQEEIQFPKRVPEGGSSKQALSMKLPSSSMPARANSTVSELNSDCGTQLAQTQVTSHVTQHQPGTLRDVGNDDEALDIINFQTEGEQRRWFYRECLAIKLTFPQKYKVSKSLISDLYTKAVEEQVPVETWLTWMREQLRIVYEVAGMQSVEYPYQPP